MLINKKYNLNVFTWECTLVKAPQYKLNVGHLREIHNVFDRNMLDIHNMISLEISFDCIFKQDMFSHFCMFLRSTKNDAK